NAFYGGLGGPVAGETPLIIAKPLNAISGTALDAGGGGTPSGIDEVRVGIQDFTSGNYWNGTDAFDLGEVAGRWRLADGDTDWQYQDDAVSDTFPTWQGETTYKAYYKMKDVAENETLDTEKVTFTWDISVPTSTLIAPAPSAGSAYIKSLPTISGTASDNSNTGGDTESGIQSVQISIEKGVGSGIFWRVSDKSWNAGGLEIWNSTSAPSGFNISTGTTGDTQWYMTGVSTPNWISGQEYRIRSRVVDRSNNISEHVYTSSSAFIYDPDPPVQAISFPNDPSPTTANYDPRLSTGAWAPASGDYGATIRGTASDPEPGVGTESGLKEVKIRIYDPTISEAAVKCWTPGGLYTDWNTCDDTDWYIPTTTNTFADWYSTFTFTSSDRKYRVEVRSEDNAGNVSVSYSTATFVVDRDAPVLAVGFPTDGSVIMDITNSYNFITGTAYDGGAFNPGNIASGEVDIQVRRNSDGQWWNGALWDGGGNFAGAIGGGWDMDFDGSTGGSAEVSSYTWRITNSILDSGTSYYITMKAIDNAVPFNESAFFVVGATFTFDNTAPTIAIGTPTASVVYSSMTTRDIKGTATDATSNVEIVRLKIQRDSDDNYLVDDNGDGNSTTWQAAVATISIPGITPALSIDWIYNLATDLTWKDSGETDEFDIYYWTIDDIGSTSAIQGPHTFIFDVTRPTAAILNPSSNGEYLNAAALTAISGTVDDIVAYPGSNTNIALVEIAMSSTPPTPDSWSWWNGSSFAAENAVYYATATWDVNTAWSEASDFTPVVGPETWEFTRPDIGAGQMENSKTYTIRIRVTDKAGNSRVHERYFIFDTDEPTLTINWPNTDYLYNLASASGTVSDVAGVIDRVEVAFSTGATDDFNDAYWNGTYWVDGAPIKSTASAIDSDFANGWQFVNGADMVFPTWSDLNDRTIRVSVWATDEGGTENTAVYKTTFTIDQSNVNSTTSFPTASAAFSSLTQITGTAEDANTNGSGVRNVLVAIERVADQKYWSPANNGFPGPTQVIIWSTAAYYVDGSSWVFTDFDTSVFDADYYYRIKENTTDYAGNTQNIAHGDIHAVPSVSANSVLILIDTATPVSVATQPAVSNGAISYMNNPPDTYIYGTADDYGNSPSGLRQIWVRISRVDSAGDREYYDWLAFGPGKPSTFDTAVDAGSLSEWRITIPPADFVEGYQYEVQSQAGDYAKDTSGSFTNTEVNFTTAAFILDYSTASIEIMSHSTGPSNINYFTAAGVSVASGTFSDPFVGGGVNSGAQTVFLELVDISTTVGMTVPSNAYYWNGSTWTTTPSTVTAAGFSAGDSSGTWEYGTSVVSQELWERGDGDNSTGRRYRVRVNIQDRSRNINSFDNQISIWVYDKVMPTSTIDTPVAEDILDTLTSVTGTAIDSSTSAIAKVYVSLMEDRTRGNCTTNPTRGFRWGDEIWTNASPPYWEEVESYTQYISSAIWEKTIPSGPEPWSNECYYIITSSAVDSAGNYQTSLTSVAFKFTAALADTGLTLPVSDGLYYNTLEEIEGTALDTPAATASIWVIVEKGTQYWDDGGAGAGSWVGVAGTSNTVPLADSWTYTDQPPEWEDDSVGGQTYNIKVIGVNSIGQAEAVSPQFDVYLDTRAPSSEIAFPAQSDTYENDLSEIWGSATDPVVNTVASGIDNARLNIEWTNRASFGKDDHQYWQNATSTWTLSAGNPADWGNNVGTWDDLVSTWTFTVIKPTIAWTHGGIYTISVRTIDNTLATGGGTAGNMIPAVDASSFTNVRYDIEEPTATVTSVIHNEAYSSLSIASGAISDVFTPIPTAKLYLRRVQDDRYWDGTIWEEAGLVRSSDTTIFTSSWTFSNLPSDFTDLTKSGTYYTFWIEGIDDASNTQYVFESGVSSKTILLDLTGPGITVSTFTNNYKTSTLFEAVEGRIEDPLHPDNAKVSTNTNVEIQIYYLDGNTTYYFEQSPDERFEETPAFYWWPMKTAAGGFTPFGVSSASWSYDRGNLQNAWISDKEYTIRVRGFDDAIPTRNQGGVVAGDVVTDSTFTITGIIIDTTPPSSVITVPGDAVITSIASIQGTADGDLAG
ncbi:hypothetical protein ACFL6Y_11065, partial [Elusimicrobiota bacterium]